MTRLAQRYRLVLRLLPSAYRQRWEEDMVAAFLDSMDTGDPETTAYLTDYGRPSVSEVASIVTLAVRLRLGGADAPPRAYAWGQAVRLATLMAVLAHAVMAAAGIAVTIWVSGRIGWLPTAPPQWAIPPPSSVWQGAWDLAGYAWLPAYLALVLGHRRVAQAIALLAVAPPAISAAVAQAAGDVPLSLSPWATLLVEFVLVLAMAAFHPGTPAVPRRPWLLALPVGVLVVPVPLLILQAFQPASRLLDWPGLSCVVVTAAIVVHLTVRTSNRWDRTLSWSLAFTLLAATALALRVATLPGYRDQAEHGTLAAVACAQAIAVLAVGAPLTRRAIRTLRQLPSIPADPTTGYKHPAVGAPHRRRL